MSRNVIRHQLELASETVVEATRVRTGKPKRVVAKIAETLATTGITRGCL